jgi:HK97 family phage prohead protease
MTETGSGVNCEATGPETSWFSDLVTSMRRGDVNGASVCFLCSRWHWRGVTRVIDQAELIEASVHAFPVYRQTTAELRASQYALMHTRLLALAVGRRIH